MGGCCSDLLTSRGPPSSYSPLPGDLLLLNDLQGSVWLNTAFVVFTSSAKGADGQTRWVVRVVSELNSSLRPPSDPNSVNIYSGLTPVSVSPSNVHLVPPAPGAQVRVLNLSSHDHLNGSPGKVLSFIPSRGRISLAFDSCTNESTSLAI